MKKIIFALTFLASMSSFTSEQGGILSTLEKCQGTMIQDTYSMIILEKGQYGYTDAEQTVLNLSLFSILERVEDGRLECSRADQLVQRVREVAKGMMKD